MFHNEDPGHQVVVVPEWAIKQLAKNGKVEDLANFAHCRKIFTSEQMLALARFSETAMSIFWHNGQLMENRDNVFYTKGLSYIWFFPTWHGSSENGDDADKYAKCELQDLLDNHSYALKIGNEYIIDYLKQQPRDVIDLHQSYSVYSASDKLIVLALNQGVLAPSLFSRVAELRLTIMRSVLEKLQMYYDMNIVHKTIWFEWYLNELNAAKFVAHDTRQYI